MNLQLVIFTQSDKKTLPLPVKIISFNVNGIRAIEKKGALLDLVEKEAPDLLFMQEIKAKSEQLSDALLAPAGYDAHYHSAEKPGYSGTGLWVRKNALQKPKILRGMPEWNDHEGRILGVESENITIFGNYFPNGGKSDAAWREKLVFYDHFHSYIRALRQAEKKILFTGDLNVAHNPIDLARPKENETHVGFRPEERAWMDRLTQDQWVDVFRERNPDAVSYTWWQMQSRARERNVGWRIDYFIVDRKIFSRVKDMKHLTEHPGSDHCPIVLDIEI